MCATRVGTLVVRSQTDEQEAVLDYADVFVTWQDHGLARQWGRCFKRMVNAITSRFSGRAMTQHGGLADRQVDDLEQERRRLEATGVKTVARTAEVCVMEASGGERFFVFSPSRFGPL